MFNKTNIQRMVDFLESAPPIDMSSHCNCAAHQITDRVFVDNPDDTVGDDFDEALVVIHRETNVPFKDLRSIFMMATSRSFTIAMGYEWVYEVDNATEVTNQMVADQLKKYL